MKKINILVPTSVLLLLAGCSSSSTRESGARNSSGSERADVAPEGSGDVFGVEEGRASAPVASSTEGARKNEGGYRSLSRAVRGGDVKAVTDETSKILTANANDPVALNALALMYARRGKPGAGKLVLNRAIEKNPNTASLYNNLGVILLEEKETAAALVQFKKALKIDGNHAEANANVGSIYAQGGDFVRARGPLEVAYRANPKNIAVANNYAVSLRVAQDYEGAKRVYEDILRKDARDLPALLNYATLLIDYMHKPKEGLDVVYKVQFLDSDRKDVQAQVIALEKKAKAEVK